MTDLRVVGIGASAGGLDAIKQVLASTPDDTGFAFVVLQHLAPTQSGMLRAALLESTTLPIVDLESGTRLVPNQVFLVPPNSTAILAHDTIVFKDAQPSERARNPIDALFLSLVEGLGARAIGVILSGTADDGMNGLRAMRNAGGATLVQDPATAQFDEMPRNAIAIGAATAVLSPDRIGVELGKLRVDGRSNTAHNPTQSILASLRDATGVDFTNYKRATIDRRIQRRMSEHGIATLEAYAAFLASHAGEAASLYEDLLIHVTEFFRDRVTLDELVARVFPAIVDSAPPAESIRIWVPGCSTGQEAYSIAMLLVEHLESHGSHRHIQVFGTDLSERSIDIARRAEYPDSIANEVGAARLARFFARTETGWRLDKSIRERCVFVRHDITADPPFSKLDLVSCRNVLIYLGPALQQGVIPMLHYALNQPGFLMIGRAESLGGFETLFTPVGAGVPIYSRQPTARHSALALALGKRGRIPFEPDARRVRSGIDVQRDVDHVLLARYAPACVLVDATAEILQFRGHTGTFLEPPPGQPSHNLIKMVRGGLGAEVRGALQRAQRSDVSVRESDLVMREDGTTRVVDLTVVPISGLSVGERNFLVIFEEARPRVEAAQTASRERSLPDEVEALTQELLATKEHLHSVLGQNSITVEELGAANEELQSMNEELLSMNEELQTAKEELQSTNEELETVNEELHRGNGQLRVLNDDLFNLLASVDIAIAIVDTEQVIRRFTPRARTLLNLLPGDIGRKITELKPNVTIHDLGQVIDDVIATLEVREAEVTDARGLCYRLQVRPYRAAGNVIAGAVISLVDISVLRRSLDEARLARDYAAAIVETSPNPMVVLDSEARVRSANRELEVALGVTAGEIVGRSWFEIGSGRWADASSIALHARLDDGPRGFADVVVDYTTDAGEVRTFEVAGRALPQRDTEPPLVLVRLADITERIRLEHERERLADIEKAAAAATARDRDTFINAVSHELRGPLNAIMLWTEVLRRDAGVGDNLSRGLATIENSARAEAQLVDDLLELGPSGASDRTLAIEAAAIDPRSSIEAALDAVRAEALAKRIAIVAELAPRLHVQVDPRRLQQMAWHLANNAVKFTPSGGRVTVSLTSRPGNVELVVSDDGQGIDSEFLPHVFEPFRRADSSTTRSKPGMGIGLALVRQLAERQGGSLSAHSDGVGHGATFRLSFPSAAG